MNAYALLWALITHVLHGRGRDQVYLAVYRGHMGSVVSAELEEFSWEGDQDRFCTLTAIERPTP